MATPNISGTTKPLAPTGPAAITETDLALAKRHFELGREYFKREDYQAAVIEFQQSYDLSRRPELLYNIAVCHYNLGNHGEALRFFRQYLVEEPNPEHRRAVEGYIDDLEKSTEHKTEAKEPPPTDISEAIFESDPGDSEEAGRDRTGIIVAFSTAAGLFAASGASHLAARHQRNQHEARIDQLIAEGRILNQNGRLRFADEKVRAAHDEELKDIEKKRDIFQGIAVGALIGGLIAAGVGGVLLWQDAQGNPIKLETKGKGSSIDFSLFYRW